MKRIITQYNRFDVPTLALGSRPRQRGCKGGPRRSPGVTSHTPRSVGKCEGGIPHILKATATLGDGVPVDSRNFREQFEGSKLNGHIYNIGKLLERRCLKWACIAHLDI